MRKHLNIHQNYIKQQKLSLGKTLARPTWLKTYTVASHQGVPVSCHVIHHYTVCY